MIYAQPGQPGAKRTTHAVFCSLLPVRKFIFSTKGIDQLSNIVTVRIMEQHIIGVIRSLQTSAVNRCRQRLEEAALKTRGLIRTKGSDGAKDAVNENPEYGVTSLLKRRHGL